MVDILVRRQCQSRYRISFGFGCCPSQKYFAAAEDVNRSRFLIQGHNLPYLRCAFSLGKLNNMYKTYGLYAFGEGSRWTTGYRPCQ